MSIYKELSYDQEIDVVRGIQFSVLSPDEIRKRSVVHVTKNDTYTGNNPVSEGLFDPRMGVLEHGKLCATCAQTNILCPGHFGHIELSRPVYHPMFFETMRKVLRCVCYHCSALLITPENKGFTKAEDREIIRKCGNLKNMQKRWDIMYKYAEKLKGKECWKCNAVQPLKYERASAMGITSTMKAGTEDVRVEWPDNVPKDVSDDPIMHEIQPEEVLRIFKRMTEEDMDRLGFNPQWNRPEWMVCQVLPVPPPAVRPSIMEESGQRREDDLTSKLCEIVKFNNMLADKIAKDTGTPEEDRRIRDIRTLLQFHIATFMNNQIPGMPAAQQRNGRKLKSIADRLKKKEGRIRGNLNGKRVDQSARSVITPDPYIGVDELGVPIRIAMNITFPEVVNSYNIAEMKRLVLAGPDQWPGAKYVRQAESGLTKTLKYAVRSDLAAQLKEGDIVDRHMRDGDYVLFNRQPSLHKMSMMGHRVRVMPWQTFRLPVSATGPYNADFDGDEMNVFQGQSIQTMSELMDFAAVPFMIMASKNGGTIIEIIQDSMVGAHRLTKPGVTIRDVTFANLQMVNSYFTGSIEQPSDRNSYSGRAAFSAMLPPGFNMTMSSKSGNRLVIQNSKYDETQDVSNLEKTFINSGIIPTIFHDYGPFEACRFLDNTSRLVCRWLLTAGFSCGISDLVLPDEMIDKVKGATEQTKAKAGEIFAAARAGALANDSILNNQDFFESKMLAILNDTKDIDKITSDGVKESGRNRMIDMIISGSKGKEINIRQMVGGLCQQNVDSKRVAYGFTDRTLPHFTKFDDGPEARGYVENSFVTGLAPHEVFFHAMAGREGLIDTAVRTSSTGYIQRRLIKAMEDCKIYYDHSVRNATGCIVQYIYAEDGMDGAKIEKQSVEALVKSTIPELTNRFLIRAEDDAILKHAMLSTKDTDLKRLRSHFEEIMDDRAYLIHVVFNGKEESSISYPIPFRRIMLNTQARAAEMGYTGAPTDLTTNYILDKIDELSYMLQVRRTTKCSAHYAIECDQGTRFLRILLRMHLSPKVILTQFHFTKAMFDHVCSEITRYFWSAVAVAGEMVGIVAAQTIGENSTQLVLDSFHSSGTVAAVKATSGVPRFQELLSVSKNIKTPILTIHLKPDIATFTDEANNDRARRNAIKVMRTLEVTRLCDILKDTSIYYSTGAGLDDELVETNNLFCSNGDEGTQSPWVLRMRLDREKMHAPHVGLTMMDIYYRIKESMGNNIQCIMSDDNATEPIIRINLSPGSQGAIAATESPNDAIATLKAIEFNLVHNKDMLLKGVRGIKKVSMHKVDSKKYNVLNGTYEKVYEWILDTDGSNLIELLSNPNVDETRTRSNDVWEIYHCLGIEAARNALYEELGSVSDALNYRHVSLLLDTMTARGSMISIDRHGINNGDVGPLAKCSFEETTEKLIDASVFSQYDRINGVSANIMLGQLPPCGTGDCEILFDEDLYLKLLKEKIDKVDVIDGEDAPMRNTADHCTMESLEMHMQSKKPAAHATTMRKAKITIT